MIDHAKLPPLYWYYNDPNWNIPNYAMSRAWRCDPADYFTGDGVCHCECGQWDPDCGEYFDVPALNIMNCAEGEYCSFMSETGFYVATVRVSTPCKQALYLPGEQNAR